ncbi:MAG: ABC transporter ATP-binding protein [Candidatus Kapabacteria bacterium]|nr:ABC transporter ATP-binding protein [Candidatus Kapabacteria bacterium]
MIEIKNITKEYTFTKALDNVSLLVEKGQIHSLLGPNGSGKTTLIKSILGLTKPNSGEILINEKSILNSWDYRKDIGYMAQVAMYPENLTGRELLEMVTEIRQQSPVKKEELIELLKFKNELDKPLKTLSEGNKQKVNATMSLMFDQAILFLDEPTAGLDMVTSRELKKFLLKEKQLGKTIIFSSHVLYDIEELSDNIIILLEGKLIFTGNKEKLYKESSKSELEDAIATLVELSRRVQND